MTPTLTPSEAEVLRLLAEGLLQKQIAAKSHRSLFTVKRHLKKVYRKLGATNAAHAVHISHQRGGILE